MIWQFRESATNQPGGGAGYFAATSVRNSRFAARSQERDNGRMNMSCAALISVTCFCPLHAQIGDPSVTFDAASVKPANPNMPDGRTVVGMLPPTGGPGTSDPSRIRYPIISLEALIRSAYALRPGEKIIGPGWLDTDFFQVEAVMSPDTTKDRFREMLRNLLADRFKLKVHRAEKGSPIWAIVVAKSGPRMKVSAEQKVDVPLPPGAFAASRAQSAPQLGADGFPVHPNIPASGAGIFTAVGLRGVRLTARQQTMHDLANVLSKFSRRPVVDDTGLTAKYDFTLTFSGGGVTEPDGDAPPDIFGAIRSLGLSLQSKTGSAELLVIDWVEKTPTAN